MSSNMNLGLRTQGPLLLTLLLITMTSVHVTEGGVPEVRNKRQSGLFNWGKGVFDKVKDFFGEEETTTTTTTWTPPADVIRLTDAQCDAALTQCALIDVTEAEYRPTWKKEYLTSLLVEKERDKVEAHYRLVLTQLKDVINALIENAINNPSLTSLHDLCDVIGPEGGEETHTTASPESAATTKYSTTHKGTRVPSTGPNPTLHPATAFPSTTPAPETEHSEYTASPDTSLAPRCQVSQWSQWSDPLGFGTQERVRRVLVPGRNCPEENLLVEYRQLVTVTPNVPDSGDTENYKTNVTVVINNVIDDFIRASEGKPRDLMLVLDSSNSIGDEDFKAMKEGVQLLVSSLCGGFGPSPTQHRLSIVQFSSDSVVRLNFNADDQSAENIHKVIDDLKPLHGFTCTGDALDLAYNHFDEVYGARSYTVHDTLVVTDGHSNCGTNLLQASHELRQRSNVYALAVGLSSSQTAVKEITSLVSNGNPHHLFSLDNFRQFQTMAESVKERREVSQCQPIILPDNY